VQTTPIFLSLVEDATSCRSGDWRGLKRLVTLQNDDVKGGGGEDWPKLGLTLLSKESLTLAHWHMTLANHARPLR